jgi:hypothetical protein
VLQYKQIIVPNGVLRILSERSGKESFFEGAMGGMGNKHKA